MAGEVVLRLRLPRDAPRMEEAIAEVAVTAEAVAAVIVEADAAVTAEVAAAASAAGAKTVSVATSPVRMTGRSRKQPRSEPGIRAFTAAAGRTSEVVFFPEVKQKSPRTGDGSAQAPENAHQQSPS